MLPNPSFQFAGTGTIYSYTRLQNAPEGYEDNAPYYLVMVQLDEGPLVTAQLTDQTAPPVIGARVEMVTRRLTEDGPQGVIVYGYKFREPIL
jgi:uncharacterized protein